MLRARSNAFAVLALSAVALGAAIAGCSTSNTPNPTITAPPIASQSATPTPVPTVTVTPTHGPPTPTPTPTSTGTGGGSLTLVFVPPSVKLTSASAVSAGINECQLASCSSDETTALLTSSDTCDAQGIAVVDPSFAEYGIYSVTPGAKTGSCQFSVYDFAPSSLWYNLQGTLMVDNAFTGAKRRLRIKQVGGH